MAPALSLALVMVGSTLLLASVLVVTRERPDEPFPLWSNPRVRGNASVGLRVTGVLLVTLGSVWGLAPLTGVWVMVPLVLAFAPGSAAILLHNAAIAHRAMEREPVAR